MLRQGSKEKVYEQEYNGNLVNKFLKYFKSDLGRFESETERRPTQILSLIAFSQNQKLYCQIKALLFFRSQILHTKIC